MKISDAHNDFLTVLKKNNILAKLILAIIIGGVAGYAITCFIIEKNSKHDLLKIK